MQDHLKQKGLNLSMNDFTSRIAPKQKLAGGFAENIEREGALVYDLRIHDQGMDLFFIIKVNPIRHDAFLRIIKNNPGFDLKDYGEILYLGEGVPSEEIKQEMREKYSMYED